MIGTQTKWITSLMGLRWLSLYWASSVSMVRGCDMGVSFFYSTVVPSANSTPETRRGDAWVQCGHAQFDRSPPPRTDRPRAGARRAHPHPGAGQLSRRRLAGGAAVLRASAQPAVADFVGADRRAAGPAAVWRTPAAPAGAWLRPVGCAGRLRARGQPRLRHPQARRQRFRAPARAVSAAGNGGLQRPDLRQVCAAVRCRGVSDAGAAVDFPRARLADLGAETRAMENAAVAELNERRYVTL